MKPPAPLNYIRSFQLSARHLSFTAAAKELGYTQAAVSTHVARSSTISAGSSSYAIPAA